MKKLLLSLAIIASISIPVLAQKNIKPLVHDRSKMMSKVDLTETQREQIKEINKDFRSKMQALRADTSLTTDAKLAQQKILRDQQKEATKNILTPEQQAKFEEFQTKASSDRKPVRQKRNPDRDIFKGIDLTEAQRAQIKALNEDFRNQTNSLNQQHREAIAKVLTAEQQAQLKAKTENVRKANKNSKYGKDRIKANLDAASVAKLESLKSDYLKEKKAIEVSRVAPEEQKRRLDELQKKYREERMKIHKEATKIKSEK